MMSIYHDYDFLSHYSSISLYALNRTCPPPLLQLLPQLAQLLNHNLMIIPLLEPTHHHHRHGRIAILDEYGYTAPVNGIVLCSLAEPHFGGEGGFVAGKLVVQAPGAGVEADDGGARALDPEVVVESGAGVSYLFVVVVS